MDTHLYQKAESFLPWNLQNCVFNSTIFPYWSPEALYYFKQTSHGKFLLGIDIKTGKKEKILDFQKLLDALSCKVKHEVDPSLLPLDGFSMQEEPRQLRFSYKKNFWCYDLDKHICIREEKNIPKLKKLMKELMEIKKKEPSLIINSFAKEAESGKTKPITPRLRVLVLSG